MHKTKADLKAWKISMPTQMNNRFEEESYISNI